MFDFLKCVLPVVAAFLVVPAWAEKRNINGEYLRDPTQPIFYSAVSIQQPKLVLQGIVVRDSGKEAIVNGKRLKVGAAVAGARIQAIEDKYIVVLRNGQESKIWLRPAVRD